MLKGEITLNELISHCVQEEERFKQEKTESAHLASTSKGNKRKRNKDKEVAVVPPQKKQHKEEKGQNEGFTCYFCGSTSHKKKQCTKYHVWCVKKCIDVN